MRRVTDRLGVHEGTPLHPVLIFCLVWTGVGFLYMLHLSRLLIFENIELIRMILIITLSFMLTYGFISALLCFLKRAFRLRLPALRPIDVPALDRQLKIWFWVWVVACAGEVVASGGIPILWLFLHNGKTYFDFGIPSIHGLLNALLLSISLCRMGLFLHSGEKKQLAIPVFVIFWSVIVVTRNMMIVNILQCSLLWFKMRKVNWRVVMGLAVSASLLLLVFGFVGDMRSGADSFRSLAQPTANYPSWLPSGILWAYIYITTPVNNLIYTGQASVPTYNLLFPNTLALLFPSVIRNLIYGVGSSAGSGDLVTEAFNVSTAFVGPMQDFGLIGVVVFSSFFGAISRLIWGRDGFRCALIYAVIGQCLFMTVFYNHFFYLPIISQIFWIYLFTLFSGVMPNADDPIAQRRNALPQRISSGTTFRGSSGAREE